MRQQLLELVVETLRGLVVGLRVAEPHAAVAVQGHAILRPRQILGREPEVDRVAGHALQRPRRRQFRFDRLLAAVHLGLRLADHLDAAERELEVVAAEVEVVQARGSSGRRSGSLPWRARAPPGCCGRCSCARADRTGWRGRSGACSVAEASSSFAELAAPQETTTMSALKVSSVPSRSTATSVTALPDVLVWSASCPGVCHQRDVGMLERRPHRQHLGVRLCVNQAREAVAGRAADAVAVGHVGLVEHHPARARGTGCSPAAARSSESCWMRGSCETAGNG